MICSARQIRNTQAGRKHICRSRTLRLPVALAMRLLAAGSVVLLAGGIGSAQTLRKSLSANPDKSTVKLQGISAHPTSRKKNKKSGKSAANWRRRGQQKIDPIRSREIQEALIREHYLDGTASGVWDAKAQTAMERYQADNGWQSKMIPDSRALIKLGLGPDHEHLLNPESAMTSQPAAPHASPISTQAPSSNPAPVNHPQR